MTQEQTTSPGKLKLTPYGQAVNFTGLSPQSARILADTIVQHQHGPNDDDGLAQLATAILENMALVPEQPNRALRAAMSPTHRAQLAFHQEDLHHIVNETLNETPSHTLFATCPSTRNSTRMVTPVQWANGTHQSPYWDAIFDHFQDFAQEVLNGFLPEMLSGAHHLAAYHHLPERPWDSWAQRFLKDNDPDPTGHSEGTHQ